LNEFGIGEFFIVERLVDNFKFTGIPGHVP
jgi:hypothetical protein